MEQPSTLETEGKADKTVERGIGPTDALVRAGNPHEFQPLTIKILKNDEDKANHQDQDKTIKLVKEWVREGRQPMGLDMNFKNSDVLAYRKVLLTLKLVLVEGTEKTILVKQGLVEGTMDHYCRPKKIAKQVIREVHSTHLHIGVDGTTRQAQKFVWMP